MLINAISDNSHTLLTMAIHIDDEYIDSSKIYVTLVFAD
jgi:hypothetical protein